MVSPFAKHVLAALALGLAIAALPGCSHSTGDAAQQQSTAISIGDCEKTKSRFTCTMSVQGFRCAQNMPTVYEQEDGEGDSLTKACGDAAAQLAIDQQNDNCQAWGKPFGHGEEITRVNKGACKKYVTAQGSLTLSHGTQLRLPSGGEWSLNGIDVQPGTPGATSVLLR